MYFKIAFRSVGHRPRRNRQPYYFYRIAYKISRCTYQFSRQPYKKNKQTYKKAQKQSFGLLIKQKL
jgi:hypothetical protein